MIEYFGLIFITKAKAQNTWKSNPKKGKGNLEYMVQIENSECREGVPSPGEQREEEERVVLHVQVNIIKKNPKFLRLSLSSWLQKSSY